MRLQMPIRLAVAAVVAVVLAASAASTWGQIRYSTGQNAAPIFEGWQKNADGTISMVFGYLNRNYEEELDIPLGDANRCEPGPLDCGQPTHFLTRRQRFVFRVTLPRDWPKDRRMSWILTSRGRTETARGTLHPEMEIDYGVLTENAGGGTLAEGNQPPTLVKGSGPQTVMLPSQATVSVSFGDDGLPKPRPRPAGGAATTPQAPADVNPEVLEAQRNRQPGVRIRWVQYRGRGVVKFDPPRVLPVYGQTVELTSKVTFSAPGAYVLRAIATDNQLEAVHDVPVTVKDAGAR
jgi:hypothetical protein